MGGLEAIVDIYNPLAKKQEPDAVVESPAEPIPDNSVTMSNDNGATARVVVIHFEKLPLRSWKDSPQVTALSSYLKGPAGHGIKMIVDKNSFSLKFNPGLRPDRNPERWQSAAEAYALLLDALNDLLELKNLGLINPLKP